MLRYIPVIAIVGVIFAIVFAAADKLIAKVGNPKKRKYLKIAVYAVIYFCMGCISTEVVLRLK